MKLVVIDGQGGRLGKLLVELLRARLHTDCIRTVHRLDAPVSGLMVLARSSRAAADTLAHATVFRNASYCRSVTHGTSLSEMLLIK